jgi:hypothetical protein
MSAFGGIGNQGAQRILRLLRWDAEDLDTAAAHPRENPLIIGQGTLRTGATGIEGKEEGHGQYHTRGMK